MKFKSLLLCLASGFVSLVDCPSAHAQAAAAQVSLKIDLVAMGEKIPGLTLDSAGKGAGVSALSFRYSKPIDYSGPSVLEISQSSKGIDQPDLVKPDLNPGEKLKTARAAGAGAAGPVPPAILDRRKANPNLVALAVIPPGSKRVTVLLAPATGGTYQTWVIDDDPSKLPFGQLRVHNLSPFPVALRCNGSIGKELKVRESFVVSPDKDRRIVYELAYKKEDEWTLQENNLLTVNDDEQAQMLVLQSDDQFFTSADGSRSGFLQVVFLRRSKLEPGIPTLQ